MKLLSIGKRTFLRPVDARRRVNFHGVKFLTFACFPQANRMNMQVQKGINIQAQPNTFNLRKYSAIANRNVIYDMPLLKPAIKEPSHAPVKQFYRRQLPDTCISFSSEEGQKIFKEALQTGHMNCYFRLAAQFRTQDEPAFCGLSSLVMVLNSLEVDPGKVWKGVWRWYHENMLDCCEPLDDVKKHGINFDQFVCLAYCNYLTVDAARGTKELTYDSFRHMLKEYTKREDAFSVLSYSRSVLGQTGDGHFSPIGGYHPDRDLVLILDVARFKYPPHWVSLELLVDAMKKVDSSTGLPRGYMLLSRQKERMPLMIFRIAPAFAVTQEKQVREGLKRYINQWNEWLSTEIINDKAIDYSDERKYSVLGEAIQQALQLSQYLPDDSSLLTTQFSMKCQGVSCDHVCGICELLQDIESSDLFKLVNNNLNRNVQDDISKIGYPAYEMEADNKMDCLQFPGVGPAHFLTVLLLSWPYCRRKDTYGSKIDSYIASILENSSELLRNEAFSLRKQIATVFNLYNCCCSKKF